MKTLWQWLKGLFGKVETEVESVGKAVEDKVTGLLPKLEKEGMVALVTAEKEAQLALKKLQEEIDRAEQYAKSKL